MSAIAQLRQGLDDLAPAEREELLGRARARLHRLLGEDLPAGSVRLAETASLPRETTSRTCAASSGEAAPRPGLAGSPGGADDPLLLPAFLRRKT